MTNEALCNREWRAPRLLINLTGEEFETLPVNHICGLPQGHDDECVCVCGQS